MFSNVLLSLWAALLVAVVVGLIAGLWVRRHLRFLRVIAGYRGMIITFLLLLGIIAGTFGHWYDHAMEVAKSSADSGISTSRHHQGFPLLVDCLYGSILDVTFNGSVDWESSVFIQIARLTGIAISILLSADILRSFFADSLLNLEMILRRKHILICGLGRIGHSIARNLLSTRNATTVDGRSAGHRGIVAAIEWNESTKRSRLIEDLGAVLVCGNATERAQLSRLNPARASRVFIVTGSDESNLETLGDLIRIFDEKPPKWPLFIYLHCMQPELEQLLWRKSAALPDSYRSRVKIHGFNATQLVLQALFDQEVLPCRPRSERDVAHYVIVGFGETSRALAVHLAQLAHFENLKRPRMTIVHRQQEAAAVAEFRQLYPAMFPDETDAESDGESERQSMSASSRNWQPDPKWDEWHAGVAVRSTNTSFPFGQPSTAKEIDFQQSVGVTFAVNGGFVAQEGGVTSPLFVDRVTSILQDPTTHLMIFICNAGDEDNTADAYELNDLLQERFREKPPVGHKLNYTILPFLPLRPMLHDFINETGKEQRQIVGWGDCSRVCTYDRITNDLTRDLAVEIYLDYVRNTQDVDGGIRRPDFGELSALDRHSNWLAAAHFNAKLAAVGAFTNDTHELALVQRNMTARKLARVDALLDLLATPPVDTSGHDHFVKKQLEHRLRQVAQMEHHRWMAERLLRDVKFGDPNRTTLQQVYHPSLLPWEKLPLAEQKKDYDQLRRVLRYYRDEAASPI